MVLIVFRNRKSAAISLVGLVAVTSICAWKVIKNCTNPIEPQTTAIVYSTRSKQVLYTTEDPTRVLAKWPTAKEYPSLSFRNSSAVSLTPTGFHLLLRSLCHTLRLYSDTYVVVPPSSFYGLFLVPKGMWDPPGVVCDLRMRTVPTRDGCVDILLQLRYCLPFDELERYLAAVGPQSPISRFGALTGQVLTAKTSAVSVGLLLSRSRRESLFIPSFKESLASKLRSELAIEVLDVVLLTVEALASD